jgi:hypothetical protein
MVRAALLLALCLVTPAAAQDWGSVGRVAGELKSADPELAYRGAIAACIAGQGKPEYAALIFASQGWTHEKDAEPGLDAFSSPQHDDVYVLMSPEGGFCAAYSEELGTEKATAALFYIIVTAQLSIDSAPGDLGCPAYALAPGVVAEITSSGSDPVCRSSRNSSIRVTFPPGN